MSPNEAQLRAALREGEGDPIDATRVISHAIVLRTNRRRRINATMAGAGIVAVVGLGVTGLAALGFGGQSSGGGGSAAGAGSATAPRADMQASSGTSSGVASSGRHDAALAYLEARQCPARPTSLALPGGGGAGQFGSSGRLFAQRVDDLKVCAYPVDGTGVRVAVLQTEDARAAVAALEAAPSTRQSGKRCTANAALVGRKVELIAVTTTKGSVVQSLKPVVIDVGCGISKVTNGTAVRYVASLPVDIAQTATRGPLQSTAPGRAHGSPISS